MGRVIVAGGSTTGIITTLFCDIAESRTTDLKYQLNSVINLPSIKQSKKEVICTFFTRVADVCQTKVARTITANARMNFIFGEGVWCFEHDLINTTRQKPNSFLLSHPLFHHISTS
jgi:hypothetical protein